ncbi:MAG: hypothetical protein DDT19_00023 [Syntrophomonadaceae bacterium]|nr:hypothetical protein [Bacillota bacterium]
MLPLIILVFVMFFIFPVIPGDTARLPCPIVADTNFKLEAVQWVNSFATPWINQGQKEFNDTVKLKKMEGLFPGAPELNKISLELEDARAAALSDKNLSDIMLSLDFDALDSGKTDADLKGEFKANVGNRGKTGSKFDAQTIQAKADEKKNHILHQTAATGIITAKEGYAFAVFMEEEIQSITPSQFDFGTVQQAQKDLAKLSYMTGQVNVRLLRILALQEMLDISSDGAAGGIFAD